MKTTSIVTLVAAAFLMNACSSADSEKNASPNKKTAARDANMQALAQVISEFLPLIASQSKFSDPNNRQRIESDTQTLRGLAHSLQATATNPADPGSVMVQEYFEEDITRALEAFRSGQTEYARHVLKDTTNYCIQCHTYSDANKKGAHINLDLSASSMSMIEKAEFYAATRQNDRALEAYKAALADEMTLERKPFEWENAARTALAIAISRDHDPKSARSIVETVSKNPQLPRTLAPTVASWKKSVQEWSRKPKYPKTWETQLDQARELIRLAEKRQGFPLDHTQDVLYFRASTLLHDVLKDPKLDTEHRAKALFWSGIAADATRDLNFWTLHETYFEQCIRLVPGTLQARECFARLRDSVVLGYSGSSGTNIPPAQQKRLNTLEEMAGQAGQ